MMNPVRWLRQKWAMTRGLVWGLPESAASMDPFVLFEHWFEDARRLVPGLPEAMTLATVSAGGRPSARMVLLKRHGPDGFVFYTNLGSRKAMEIGTVPWGALVLFWGPLHRQIRIEGRVERLPRADAQEYFSTRPRGSQLGAWASKQSQVLSSRKDLGRQFEEYRKQFDDRDVPLPEFWGGFRLEPDRIEFWHGRANRLHDRLLFTLRDGEWRAQWLYP